jgi:outer membrane receptor protein involved in Fe transport
MSYIKFEKRQSSDISWFLGAKGGVNNNSFRHAPVISARQSIMHPHGEINLSWLRHICESSNYLINLFLRTRAPVLAEFNPIFNDVYHLPNPNLKNETEFLFESHLYRKFEDKFEIQLSPYFRYSWNSIVLKDNFGNSNEKIKFGLNEYFTQQYTNQSQIADGGAQLELKYNFSKQFLVYHQINFQHVWTMLDSNLFYPSLPLYGNLGLKYKSNKLFLHSWLHFNGGRNFTDSVRSQYIQFYARQSGSQKEFPAYFDLNFGLRYQFVENLSAQFNFENILNQFSLDFLSTLPNQGRRIRLQVVYSL